MLIDWLSSEKVPFKEKAFKSFVDSPKESKNFSDTKQ